MIRRKAIGFTIAVIVIVLAVIFNTGNGYAEKSAGIYAKGNHGISAISVSWDKVEKVQGYYVYRSADTLKNFKKIKTVKASNLRRIVDKNVAKGRTYYYYVQGYMVADGARVTMAPSETVKAKVAKAYANDPKNKLMVVNKNNRLTSSYVPTNMKNLNGYSVVSVLVKSYVRDAYINLYKAAKKDGLTILAISGYRSYYLQNSLFYGYVSSMGIKEAERSSARPGTSEHQTGLAIDVTSKNVRYDLVESYGKKPEGKWLEKNAYKYGFIIRYPKGKESITGYMYEPWHIRFVGKEAARYIHNNKITLEQYMKY